MKNVLSFVELQNGTFMCVIIKPIFFLSSFFFCYNKNKPVKTKQYSNVIDQLSIMLYLIYDVLGDIDALYYTSVFNILGAIQS